MNKLNKADKSRDEVKRDYEKNQALGIKTERELELMRSQAEQYTATHAGMAHNGTTDLDRSIQRVREEVKQNVHHVLEGQQAQSEQVQNRQLDAALTAQNDSQAALTNKRLESNVSQAVVDVIGGQQHEAIKIAFEEEARFQDDIDANSRQDQQKLQRTTETVKSAVNQTLNRLTGLL
ncbi:hypothetical protein SAMN04489707_102525 [Paenacidovorax caeni]|uniref:Uncharacterized protein n=1 Tax=Paenacidovorax caeni TaxID=343013 RepID=A0A1I7JEA8_9BURK|nr:hypothetical protein [Paenacidovorax caeni]SFU83490.1 hypothetical protein SAMN04489707_102525 [Paenacidovorax caeni]